MSSKKQASLSFLYWLVCLSVLLAISPFGRRSGDALMQYPDADSTRNFTAEVITLYLNETYGDKADQIWKEWKNDKGWATMITHAQVGDSLALIASDGSVSWYSFMGHPHGKLDGIYEVFGPNGTLVMGRPISGEALEKIRANYALIGGLFRESDNTIALSWYPSGLQEAKSGYSGRISEIDIHRMTQIEHYAWKGGVILIMVGVIGLTSRMIQKNKNKFFMLFLASFSARMIIMIISIATTYICNVNVDSNFNPLPIDSVAIGLTVDLYEPNQIPTQKNDYYRQYKMGFIGTPKILNRTQYRKRPQRQEYDYSEKYEISPTSAPTLAPTPALVDEPIRLVYYWSYSSERACGNLFSY